MKRFNRWLAVNLSKWFSTMACFYAFCVLALLPLAWPKLLPVVQFVSSGFLQLVALPLLAVAAKIIQDQQSHIKAQSEQHAADIAALHAKHDDLHAKHDDLHAKHDERHEAILMLIEENRPRRKARR